MREDFRLINREAEGCYAINADLEAFYDCICVQLTSMHARILFSIYERKKVLKDLNSLSPANFSNSTSLVNPLKFKGK